MKKTYKLISVLLVSIMLLCSCSTEVVIPKTELPAPTAPTESPVNTLEDTQPVVSTAIKPEYNVRDIMYGLKLGLGSEPLISPSINTVVMSEYPDYIAMKRFDVPKTIVWNFCGREYTLNYYRSEWYTPMRMMSDIYVDCYTSGETINDYGFQAYFKHGTTQLVYLSGVYTDERINAYTEEEHVNFIKNELLKGYDEEYLDAYGMGCASFLSFRVNGTEYVDDQEVPCVTNKTILEESFVTGDEDHVKDTIFDNYGDVLVDEVVDGKPKYTVFKYSFGFSQKNRIKPGEWYSTANYIYVEFFHDQQKNTTYVQFENRGTNYSYTPTSTIPLSKNELEYGKQAIKEVVDKRLKGYTQITDVGLKHITVLHGKPYLVYAYSNKKGVSGYIYVDYQAMQKIMTLEGRT